MQRVHDTPLKTLAHGRPRRLGAARFAVIVGAILCCWRVVSAQSLDEVLDEDAYLNGLVELRLPEVLESYAKSIAGDDVVRQVKFELARRRLAVTDPAAAPEERLAALEASLVMRAKLIEEHEGHPDMSIWMGDQAAALYFDLWPIDAAGLTTLFGLPSETERERAKRVAKQLHEWMTLAAEVVDRAIVAVRSQPEFARDERLQARALRLSEQERDRRLAFLRGIGDVLHAELNAELMDERERLALYHGALRTLTPLAERLGGRLINISLVHAALAHARLGKFDEAEAILERVATDPSTHEGEVFLARMVGVINREVRGGPESGLTALESLSPKYQGDGALFFRVLLAERRFQLLRAIAQSQTGDEQQRTMQRAYASLTSLLDERSGAASQTMRAIVYEKLSTATREGPVDVADVPPIVALARAENLLAEGEKVDEAIAALAALLGREDLDDSLRGEAMFTLGHARHAAGDAIGAATEFCALARRFPTHERAAKAIVIALALTARERTESNDAAAPLFEQALELMLARFSHLPELDQWLYAAGQFELAAGNWAAATSRFARITPEAANWPDALFMQVLTLKRQADAATSQDERTRLLDELQELSGRLRPQLSNRVDSEKDAKRARELRHRRDSMRVYEAEALLELDDLSRVVPLLNGMELAPEQDPALIAQALRLRIDAFERMGRTADARREMEQFMSAAPQQFSQVALPMLQSLVGDVERLLDSGDAGRAAEQARRDVVPLAQLIGRWLSEHESDAASHVPLRAKIADALRLGGEFSEALRMYDELLARRPDASELLLGKAECLYAMGAASGEAGRDQLGDAMVIYRRIAGGVSDTGSAQYWLSQLRMLQILDKTGQNADKISPRIEQLRLRDATFGGARYQRWFVELQNKYS